MMNNIYKAIEEMRQHFGWDKTDTIDFVANCIVEEAQELNEAVQLQQLQEIKDELADVLMYAFTLAKMLNCDIEDIINKKIEIVKQRNYE